MPAATDRQPRPQPTSRTLKLAAQLLRRDRLGPRPGITSTKWLSPSPASTVSFVQGAEPYS